jgi:hypothetical protein
MEARRRPDDFSRRNRTMELLVGWRPWRRHKSDGANDRDGCGQYFGDRVQLGCCRQQRFLVGNTGTVYTVDIACEARSDNDNFGVYSVWVGNFIQ